MIDWGAVGITEPDDGWRAAEAFTEAEKTVLRPIAETLAMLDGNAFFGMETDNFGEWYEMYLPEAHALFESNGGLDGWAGEASFARDYRQRETCESRGLR